MMAQMVSFFSTNGAALNLEPEFIDGIATEQTGYAPVEGE
jgi:hypothetical protein